MTKENENLTESELKKMAYLTVQRLRHSGLDNEVIYARLEKQGIPEAIAREALADVATQSKREAVEREKPVYNFALVRIGIGIGLAAISVFIFPGYFILPVGLIASGIISALLAKKRMNE